MKRKLLLLNAWAVICLLAMCLQPAAAYIGIPPQTLGDLCRQSTHIYVLQLEKFSAERGVLLFKPVAPLKMMTGALSDATLAKQVIGPNVNGGPSVNGAKVILDWAAEGKMAILFAQVGGLGSEKSSAPAPVADRVLDFKNRFGVKAQVCIDGYWYSLAYDGQGEYWSACKEQERSGRPALLSRYCGSAEKLRDAVTRILRGEEVVVPALASDNEIRDLRASLQILGENPKLKNGNPNPESGEKKFPEKKPEAKKPDEKKAEERKPDLVGTVKALSADGKSFRLQPAPMEKNKEAATIEIQLTERTKITDGKEVGRLAVGQNVSVWRGKGAEAASEIQIGRPGEKPAKKPEPEYKPEEPKKKPESPDAGKKPVPDATEKKPEEPAKPKESARPVRDPAPTAAVIDAAIDRQLAALKVPASPAADDAEFLRRVTLDLTGRIPTYQRTIDFLDSKDPDKRRKLIDELLESPAYGEHFGTIWRNLIGGREIMANGKGGGGDEAFRPWLTEQFNNNRGWDAIVKELLTAEGTSRDNPAISFLMANTENGLPRPNKVTGSVAALFWGLNLRCAECHRHPFAHWNQDDFWGVAAFFGKVQYGGGKGGGPQALAEAPTVVSSKEKGQPVTAVRGAAIAIPNGSGKAAGKVVKARFLGGDEPALEESEPFRPRFAAWATSADNPYFGRALVNRLWANFFGRGFVNPLDGFDEANAPSHPELLDRLAKEFASADFDLKHLARCIANSKAYQRSSRPVPGNEADTAFSHMAVKALTPEVFFDSLTVIGSATSETGKGGGSSGKGSGEKQEPRDQFLRSFRVDEAATATDYTHGIPQLLRLMNASTVNRGAAVVDRLHNASVSSSEAVTALYLTVLSRRPTEAEIEIMSGYLSRRKDSREGYRGVLWMLLNSSEFALNH